MAHYIRTAAVVLAAGEGSRFGRPKQFETIRGESLITRVVVTASEACDQVIVVVPPGYRPDDGDLDPVWDGHPVHAVVRGGATHGESARIGLAQVPHEIEVVVMASTSHPLAGPDLYQRVIDAVAGGADGAAPIGLIPDAVKRHVDGRVTASVDKSDLVMVQAPCAFNRHALVVAYESFGGPGQPPMPPEELEMIGHRGGRIELVEGEPTNIHVTTPIELEMARRLIDLVPHH